MVSSVVKELNTERGVVYIRAWAPREVLKDMGIEDGLGAFWYYNKERVRTHIYQSLSNPQAEVVLAHTGDNLLVGYYLISVPGRRGRWQKLGVVYETTIEVARGWRRYGIAGSLLSAACYDPHWQDKVFLAEGYSWAWDLNGTGLTAEQYRDMWRNMLAGYGFVEVKTDDPGILGDRWSLMMARMGPDVTEEKKAQFFENLVLT